MNAKVREDTAEKAASGSPAAVAGPAVKGPASEEPALGSAGPSGDFETLLRTTPSRQQEVARPTPAAAQLPPPAVRLGLIASVDSDGTVRVDIPGSSRAVAARLGVATSIDALAAAMRSQQPVILTFENGDAALPIILGLIQEPAGEAEATRVIEADVDGKRVRIVAQDEIVFECGQASVTLRRNGRVVIRGTYVETCSEGTNRIKGGQVRIN